MTRIDRGADSYYSRKQLKHARNAALTALIWAAVFVLAVVQAWVAQ